MKTSAIIFAYICLFCLGFLDNSRGPLYPNILSTFNISTQIGSFLFSSSAFSAFVLAIFSSKIIKKYALVLPSQFGVLSFALSSLCLSLAPKNEYGVAVIILASLILGIGVGIHSVSLNLIINESTDITWRRRVFAGLHSMYGVASFLAPMIISKVVVDGFNWQDYFLYLSGVLFFIFITSFFFTKKEEKTHKDQVQGNVSKPIWPLGVMFSCYVCAEVMLSSRLVLFTTEHYGLNYEEARNYLSLFFALLLAGRLSFAIFPIKIDSKKLLLSSTLLSFILLVLGIKVNPVFLSLTGLSMSFFFPCAMDFAGSYFKENEVDLGISKIMIAVGGALVLLHFSFGQLTSYIGVSKSIYLIPTLVCVVLYILQVKLRFLAKDQ